MFGFFRKRAEVLNHWIAFADGFQMSPTEFYKTVEMELSSRKVPAMELSRIDFAQGGLLSEKRVYLRMLRERIVFDVCAAPFGNGFFFSCRTAEIPNAVKLWQIVALFLLVPWLFSVLLYLYGRLFGPIYGFFFLFLTAVIGIFGIYLLRNLVAFGLSDLDRFLIQLPVLGPIYTVFFRKESYYRIDARLCYLHLVPTLVRQLAEEATAAQGIKLMQQFELSPILGELYKPARRETVDLNISVDNPPSIPPRISI